MSASADIAAETIDVCARAAAANRATAGRRGTLVSIDDADDILIAADLHGNRLNFTQLLRIADLANHPRRHLVMQEVCHGGPEYPGGGCMSHLLLEDCARLKNEFPDRFHFLLSNHELAELSEFPICKARKMLNLSFRTGIACMYGAAVDKVRASYMEFLASCPLAIKLVNGVLVTHSIPDKCDTIGFDIGVFDRPLTPADWKNGSAAFRLVWGRDFRPANVAAFMQLANAELSVTGHEPCPDGYCTPNPQQLILDSCCNHPSYLLLPVGEKLPLSAVVGRVARLHNGVCHERPSREAEACRT